MNHAKFSSKLPTLLISCYKLSVAQFLQGCVEGGGSLSFPFNTRHRTRLLAGPFSPFLPVGVSYSLGLWMVEWRPSEVRSRAQGKLAKRQSKDLNPMVPFPKSVFFLLNRQVHEFDPLFRLFVRVRKLPPHLKLVFHYAWEEIPTVSAFCDHVKHAAGDSLWVMSSSSVCKVG